MKKAAILLTLTVTLAVFALVAVAQAKVAATIQVKDQYDKVLLEGQSVHLNTKIQVFGTYQNPSGTQATYNISIYLNQSSVVTRVYSRNGTVISGETVISDQYTLNQLGMYEFRFTVTSGAETSCNRTWQDCTTIYLVTPEPATLAALTMGLGALGLFALKKRRTK